MKKPSQNELLKKHLKSGKSIAPMQALNKLGIYRLASRINDLRNEGLNIKTEMVHEYPVKYAKYYL
jgi:hypothetical protein